MRVLDLRFSNKITLYFFLLLNESFFMIMLLMIGDHLATFIYLCL